MITLKADLSRPIQENFEGLGAIYHAFAGMPDDAGRVYTEEQCALEAKRAADMRVKVVRSYFSWYAWDAKTNTWDWDNERCTAFYKWARRMKDAGITVVVNTGWWNIGDLMGDYHAGPCPFFVKGDWKKTVQNYADWVSEVVKEIIIKRGFDNIKYFCLFTEPNECIVPSFPYENCEYRELWYDSAIAVHNTLVKNGLRDKIKLLGPQEGVAFRHWFTEWAINEKHCDEWLDGFSMHNYLMFDEVSPEDVHGGDRALVFPFAGCRAQQDVLLKKNTDYTVSIWLKFKMNVPVTDDSSMIFGVFGKGSFKHYFNNYCEPRDAIFTKSISHSELKNEWVKYEFTFNSGDNEKVTACVFSDLRRRDGKKDSLWQGMPFLLATGNCMIVDDFSIREKETNRELLKDTSFECANDWYVLWARPHCTDNYVTWIGYEKDAINVLPPKHKSNYWHDEYNVVFDKKSDPTHGTWLSLGQVAMMNGGGKGSFMWTLFDQQWPNNHTNSPDAFEDGVHIHGLMPVLTKSLVPHPAYYAWGMVSRYTGGCGTKCYCGINCSNEKVAMNVNELADGNYTVTVVNYSDKEQEINIELNKSINRTFYRHSYDPKTVSPDESATLPVVDKVFENVEGNIIDTIPSMGVTVYTTLDD